MSRSFSVKNYEEAFDCEGSLRDIYVESISRDDWNKFLKLAKSDKYRPSFWINGGPALIPSNLNELFYPQMDASLLLEIDVSGVKLNCHFFLDNELELDLDPREVTSDEKAEAILAFMSQLGRVLGREVVMTAENRSTAVIFRYDPSVDNVTYVAPSSTKSEQKSGSTD